MSKVFTLIAYSAIIVTAVIVMSVFIVAVGQGALTLGPPVPRYVVIGWNNLGMHCYNPDFSNLAILPPYNTLMAQVILRGDPPKIVTSGVNVTYSFPEIPIR